MRPSRDPYSSKYKDDPERFWYGGQWRDAAGVRALKAAQRRFEKTPKRNIVKRRWWHKARAEGRLWEQQPENVETVLELQRERTARYRDWALIKDGLL